MNIRETKEVINLSLENITPELLPKIQGISFVLFSREQIKEKIKTGFLYYAFGNFKIKDGKVLVTFGRYFENLRGEAAYSSGLTYEFKKVKSKWKGESVDGFSSIS